MEEYESADSPWDRGYYHGDNSNGFNRRVSAFMERAQNGIEYARNKEALRESIQGILGSMSSDGIQGFIPDSADRTYLLNAFMEKCREYTSAEEAEREYSQKSGNGIPGWRT